MTSQQKIGLHPCLCGGKAKWLDIGPMCDQLGCDTCDYKTPGYFDGAEYACGDWQRRNKPREDGQTTLVFPKRSETT